MLSKLPFQGRHASLESPQHFRLDHSRGGRMRADDLQQRKQIFFFSNIRTILFKVQIKYIVLWELSLLYLSIFLSRFLLSFYGEFSYYNLTLSSIHEKNRNKTLKRAKIRLRWEIIRRIINWKTWECILQLIIRKVPFLSTSQSLIEWNCPRDLRRFKFNQFQSKSIETV